MTAIHRGTTGRAGRRTALPMLPALPAFGAAAFGAAATLLAACAPEGGEAPDRAMAAARQKIVVEFSLPAGLEEEEAAASGEAAGPASEAAPASDPDPAPVAAAREVADRILSRLSPEVRQSARTFDLLPLIALEADPATMMQLVRMPEVVSVRADREIPVPAPPGGVSVPSVPSGGKAG